jgi:hypothetical protein
MKNIRRLVKTSVGALALLAPCAAAHAVSITFAAFSDTAPNQWIYSGGVLSSVGATASFISYSSPNQILNYSGLLTYKVSAVAAGPASTSGGFIRQPMNGTMTFKNGSITVLDVAFSGAIITGQSGSNSTGFPGDTNIAGNIISYNSDPSVLVGSYIAPFSFSIALTQIPGITVAGTNLGDFTATASGTFLADSQGGGASPPTPLPQAAFGGPVLIAGLWLCRRIRRRRQDA